MATTTKRKTTTKKAGKYPYVLVRAKDAGVFAGELISRKGDEVILKDSRRIWYWAGAASLSQLAMEGTKKPSECKFPCPIDRHEIFGAIEIIRCTPEARKSIESVPVWSA